MQRFLVSSYISKYFGFFLCAILFLAAFLQRAQLLINVEEIQSIFMPLVVLLVFISTRRLELKIPSVVFITTLVIWLLLVLRVPIMNKFNFFEGRLIVGKFEDDKGGYGARKIFKSLKMISTTYHLPGPSLLPYSNSKFDLKTLPLTKFENTLKQPALVLFGIKKGLELRFPDVPFGNSLSCSENLAASKIECENLPSSTLIYQRLPGLIWAIAPLQNKILIRREPEYVVNHYVAWLAAYFSTKINFDRLSRIDVLTEILNLKALPVEGQEITFAKLILSYEQLLSQDIQGNEFDQIQTRKRLREISFTAKKFLGPELYGMSMNLLALLSTYEEETEDQFSKARIILKDLVRNRQIPKIQRQIAAHNLAEIDLMFN